MTMWFLPLLLSLPLPAADQDLVLVVGHPGEEAYRSTFDGWAARWALAARLAGLSTEVIGREPAAGDDRDRLREVLEAAGSPDAADRPLWLVLIGHGTFDGRDARFNLNGPDITAEELGSWLDALDRPVAVVNCSSASGPFLARLSGPKRVVVTAARSGAEQNFARFGDYFSAALWQSAADLDGDAQTSLLEAYLFASNATAQFYESEGRLATEHALLDDNGDSLGTPASFYRGTRPVRTPVEGAETDGIQAHQWHLVRSPWERSLSLEDRRRRDRLEQELEQLRSRKDTFQDSDEYYREVESLVVELAELYASAGMLRSRGGP